MQASRIHSRLSDALHTIRLRSDVERIVVTAGASDSDDEDERETQHDLDIDSRGAGDNQHIDDSESIPSPAAMLSPEAAAVLAALPHATTPYLTCSRCNSVTFINVLRVRPSDAPKDESRLREFEQLPICSGCGSTKYLRAGVVSFQEQIAEARNAIKEFERRRVPATALLQRIARGYLGRLEFRRRKLERERYIRQIHRAATQIQTRVRGMQARRCALIERCLRIIQSMHASILAFALAARPDRPPVFWYANPSERRVFLWNYREFVRRSGGRPTLIQVELNVLEITRRVLLREYALASRIQSCWRGIATRLVYRAFKRERAWLRGVQQSPVIKIQRLFRGHTNRKRCRALRVTVQYPTQLSAYRAARHDLEQQEKRKAFRAKLLGKYRVEYQSDKTTRMFVRHVKLPLDSSSSSSSKQAAAVNELGPETQAHVQHSLKHGSAASLSARSAPKGTLLKASAQLRQRARGRQQKRANQHDADTDTMLSVSEIKECSNNKSDDDDNDGGDNDSSNNDRAKHHGSSDNGDALRQRASSTKRNANSQRFAEIKRKLERRHGPRDPRTHIFNAQQLYAAPALSLSSLSTTLPSLSTQPPARDRV